jgi:hypothetical protein
VNYTLLFRFGRQVHTFLLGLYSNKAHLQLSAHPRKKSRKEYIWPQTFLSVFLTGTGTNAAVRVKKQGKAFLSQREARWRNVKGEPSLYTIEAPGKNISPRMLNFSQLHHETYNS